MIRRAFAIACCAGFLFPSGCRQSAPVPVRVAVIGGMTMSGLWPMVAEAFTAKTGIPVELAVTGPKDVLDGAFRAGGIDLLTMHSSDTATRLVADGLACNMRPWTYNEHVIVGPEDDPAGIRGMTDGAAALARIAAGRHPFVEARNTGSHEVSKHLWDRAGMRPSGDWLIRDGSESGRLVVEFARSHDAYVVVGRIPVRSGKMPSGGMEVLVKGDPGMRRPYVVLEAVPETTRSLNPAGARLLADFLLSPEGQQVLAEHGRRQSDGLKLFFPLSAAAAKDAEPEPSE
ncbi:MAG: substrate-binding domain-containing protein [Chthoniobacterales bacterium]|nr:substrate-binding domain-containing protein [Chthoniobacterales bacterium]